MPGKRKAPVRREAMGGLAKGLEVIRAFTRDQPTLMLSEVAAVTGLSAATARRCLLTLEELGYVTRHGRSFLLSEVDGDGCSSAVGGKLPAASGI